MLCLRFYKVAVADRRATPEQGQNEEGSFAAGYDG